MLGRGTRSRNGMVRASGGLVWFHSSLRAVQWLVGAAEALAGGGYKSLFALGAAWLGRTAESVVGAELSGPSSGGTWHRRGAALASGLLQKQSINNKKKPT